jgi:hypothetical protein
MIGMSRSGRAAVSALLAGLALVATLPVPCNCLPAPVAASEHACCAPAYGLRPAESGCCAAVEPGPDTTAATPAPSLSLAPAFVVVVWALPVVGPALEHGPASPEPLISPPLSVRRL